jgi:hypothetical protein
MSVLLRQGESAPPPRDFFLFPRMQKVLKAKLFEKEQWSHTASFCKSFRLFRKMKKKKRLDWCIMLTEEHVEDF